jgi:hypothetical protein
MELSEQVWWEVEADNGKWAGLVDPTWITSTVIALCQQIEKSKDASLLPILADALHMDAGCEDALLLKFLRENVVIRIASINGPMGSYKCRRDKGMSREVIASQIGKLSRFFDGGDHVFIDDWKAYQDAKRKHYLAQEQCKNYLTNPDIKAALLALPHPHPAFRQSKKWWDYCCWFTEKRLYPTLLRKLKELMKENKSFAVVVEESKHERVATAPLVSGQRVLDWDDV